MCTKLPQQAALALAISALALFIMAIVEFTIASQLGENPLLKNIKEFVFAKAAETTEDYEAQIKNVGVSPFQAVGIAFASLTLTAMMFAVVTAACATKICPRNKIWRCIAVIWIIVTCCVFFGLGIALLAVGGAIAVPNYDQLFTENCKLTEQGKFDEIYPAQARPMFQIFGDVDKSFKEAINLHMCTDLCMCDGTTGDKWYNEYKNMKAEKYTENDRQFSKPANFDATEDPDYMHWSMGDVSKENFASDSMYECLENIDENVDKRVKYEYDRVRKTAGGTKAKASAAQQNAKKLYAATKESVDSNKPTPALSKFLNFIESEYNCAGICSPPLFYYSKSISNGPPKRGCINMMVADMAPALSSLGRVLIVSGVLIILMIFCALPICCLKNDSFKNLVGEEEDDDDTFATTQNEGVN